MIKTNRIITGFLGVSMLMFGLLKFINPFKGWYTAQVMQSELPFPTLSFWFGQLGEIIVGALLLYTLVLRAKLSKNNFNTLFVLCNTAIIIMMLVAFYVHLHPNVPAEVLPLKIRPPFIPGAFLCLGILNLYLKVKKKENR